MNKQGGFTILEVVVSITVFVVAIIMVTGIFSSVQKTYRAGSDKAEAVQNARVALDRMSREIRQAVDFVNLATTSTTTIEFQDGHNQDTINYINYHLDQGKLIRDVRYYYFNADPSTKVLWNHLDGSGNAPISTTTGSSVIGEYFSTLEFSGIANGVDVNVEIRKNNAKFKLETQLYYRN